MTRRSQYIVVAVLLLGAGFVGGRLTSPDTPVDSGVPDAAFCDVAAELVEVDANLTELLHSRFETFDRSAVRWRHLMGDLRLVAVRSIKPELERESLFVDLESSTLDLEMARLGLLRPVWDERQLEAGILLDGVLRAHCGMGFSDEGWIMALVNDI